MARRETGRSRQSCGKIYLSMERGTATKFLGFVHLRHTAVTVELVKLAFPTLHYCDFKHMYLLALFEACATFQSAASAGCF